MTVLGDDVHETLIDPIHPPAPPALRPTRVRYKVVGVVIAFGMITYLDRVCISTLAPHIMADLSLTKVQMGYVFSAFALAYALFEIPTAKMADRQGTRIVLTRIVAWWSAFTLATAAATGYRWMLIARFLFGAGEAGAWPCMARTFSRWIPQHERGKVQGIFFAGAHLMGALTPMIVTALLAFLPWRMVFVCFGLVGLVWTAVWYAWFRDEPTEHPAVNEAERALITAGRGPEMVHHGGWAYWKKLLTDRNVLALCIMYFPNSFVFYFCITWFPTYLKEKHGFDTAMASILSGLPLCLAMMGDLFGGLVTDRVTARFGLRHGRATVGVISYLIAAAAMLSVPFCPDPFLAVVLISVAVAATMFSLAGAWATCMDIGREHTGTVGATMNTAGQVGSLFCPLIVAYSLEWFGNWNITIYLMGALFLVGAGCWWVVDPRQRVFE